MSLRRPIEREAALPDGRRLTVKVGVAEDAYIARRELSTVSLELLDDGRVTATVNTVLEPSQEREALVLVSEIVEGLESGRLEPSVSALEPLADRLP